jgi:hypothetical protein
MSQSSASVELLLSIFVMIYDVHAKRLMSTICHFTLDINLNDISVIASARFLALL